MYPVIKISIQIRIREYDHVKSYILIWICVLYSLGDGMKGRVHSEINGIY